jgi:hypothetical protein
MGKRTLVPDAGEVVLDQLMAEGRLRLARNGGGLPSLGAQPGVETGGPRLLG